MITKENLKWWLYSRSSNSSCLAVVIAVQWWLSRGVTALHLDLHIEFPGSTLPRKGHSLNLHFNLLQL